MYSNAPPDSGVRLTAESQGFVNLKHAGRRVMPGVGRVAYDYRREIRMYRTAGLLILSLVLLCSPPAAYGEDVSALVEGVKAAVKEKAPCWKLFHQQGRRDADRAAAWVNWACGEEGVVAYLYHEPSVEAAVKLFHEMRTAPVAAPGRAVDSYKFGDESFVTSFNPYSRSSYVFFRKGNIIVRIDSGTNGKASSARTLKNAVRFARLFVEQLSAPPGNGMHPTPSRQNP